MAAVVDGYDVIGANIRSVPSGQLAGYSTGSGPVPWSQADWNAHPGAIRICQNPGATDTTADVLDVESGAATLADCAPWAKAALAHYNAGTRPGQRRPAIYCSQSEVTPVVNALIRGGVSSGVGLWVASWGIGRTAAVSMVSSGSGPFPVIGVQYQNAGAYDVDVWSAAWLAETSHPGGGGSTLLHAWVPGGP